MNRLVIGDALRRAVGAQTNVWRANRQACAFRRNHVGHYHFPSMIFFVREKSEDIYCGQGNPDL